MYCLFKEVAKKQSEDWWEDAKAIECNVKLFNSFEEAKLAIREELVDTVKKYSKEFGYKKNKKSIDVMDFIEDILDEDYPDPDLTEVNDMLNKIYTDSSYMIKDKVIKDFYADEGCYAFILNNEGMDIEAYLNSIKTNIHNMSDENKNYYFNYTYTDVVDYFPSFKVELKLVKMN